VEVYYLRRLTLLEKVRREHKLPKSARGDIRALMKIEERWFRRVTEDFLVMRRMVLAHRSLMKTHQQVMNKYKALSEAEREVLKPAISSIEKQLEEMAKKITEEAGKRYPAYNVLLEGLGINDGLAGREALAELLTYADFVNSSLRGLKKLVGLYKPINSSRTEYWRLYDGKLRYAVNRLAMAFYNNRPNGRQCWELVKQIKQLVVTAQAPG
jgi:HD superfamily phosphohydrolase